MSKFYVGGWTIDARLYELIRIEKVTASRVYWKENNRECFADYASVIGCFSTEADAKLALERTKFSSALMNQERFSALTRHAARLAKICGDAS